MKLHGDWGKFPRTGRKEISLLSLRKARRVGNTGQSALPQIPRKVMDQILLEAISKHMKGKTVTGNSQRRFTKGKPYLTSLTAFYHKFIILVDKGRALGIVYLDFSKCFNAISYNILMDKLMK